MIYPGEFFPVSLIFAALDNEDLAFTVVDIVFHLRGGEAEHDGDDDEASLCGSSIDLHPFGTVIGKDGKAVALLHTESGKGIGESAGAFVPLFKGKFSVKVFEPILFGHFAALTLNTSFAVNH